MKPTDRKFSVTPTVAPVDVNRFESESTMSAIDSLLKQGGYRQDEIGIYRSGNEGYWSNLNRSENERFIAQLETSTPQEAVQTHYPQFSEIIFSPQREAGLELLNIKPGEKCIDFGCMWGSLSVGMAKRGGCVISMDQTYDSLRFVNKRKKHEQLPNLVCVQEDIRKVQLTNVADVAVVNGVMEWVPEFGNVELKKFYGKRLDEREAPASPENTQRAFIKAVGETLKPGGRLLLAIENRYDFHMFIGKRDPHANLFFTSFLPRSLATWLSRIQVGRPYVNYLYSFQKLRSLIEDSGFGSVDLYAVFPDYRFPRLILPYDGKFDGYVRPSSEGVSLKRKIVNLFEFVLMRVFKGKFFAPSIIAIAKK